MSRVRKSFSLYVDNIPPYMTSLWLWKIFKNKGKIVDVYVSRKAHPNRKFLFVFVRFSSEFKAQNAIRRNNGLEVKIYTLAISVSKYEKMKSHKESNRALPKKSKERMVWRPTQHGDRSYIDVIMNKIVIQG